MSDNDTDDSAAVLAYLDGLDEPRRDDLRALHELMRASAPGLAPALMNGDPVYGRFHYRYASGREGDSAVVTMRLNKNYISVYVNCVKEDGYLAEGYRERLPKASIGRSCVRFRRLSDVDTAVLAELFTEAAVTPPAGAAMD
jgi:hypothetical protein